MQEKEKEKRERRENQTINSTILENELLNLPQHMLLGEPNDQFDQHHWHSALSQTMAQ